MSGPPTLSQHSTHLQDVLYSPLEGGCPPGARGRCQAQDLRQVLLPTELELEVTQHDFVVDGFLVRVVALVYHQEREICAGRGAG